MDAPAAGSARRRIALAVALAALLLHVVLTLMPPPAAPQWPPLPDSGLLARLFPAVPGAWVLARLAAIAVAFVLVAACGVAACGSDRAAPAAAPAWPAPDRRWSGAAVVVAVLQLLIAPFAASLPRAGQLAWIACLALPALLLAVACRGDGGRRSAPDPVHWPLVLGVIVVWLAVRAPLALHSPLIATPADSVVPFEGAQRALDPGFDLLGGAQFPGYTSLLAVFQGPILLGLAPADLTPAVLQSFQILWLAVSALLVARLVAAFGVPGAAPVAAAAFLFAPISAFATLLLGPLYLGTLVPGFLLLLAVAAVRDSRPWAVAAAGAVAGAATTHPSIAPLGLLVFAGTGLLLWRRRPPLAAAAAALLGFVATVLPGLPSPTALAGLASSYADGTRMWAGIEALGLGQVPTEAAEFHIGLGIGGPLDTALGVLLSPWATPRTAMRLWGDSIFEPVGAGLFTVGLAVAAFGTWRRWPGRGLVVLGLVALLPGLLSSYDRPSLTRPLALPLAFSLVAGFGFAWLVRPLRQRTAVGVAAATAAAIGVAGTYQFDVVNRRLLPTAAVSIAIAEVDGRRPCAPAVLLNTGAFDVQAVDFFAGKVPRCPLATAVVGPGAEDGIAVALRHAVAFWSPGVEMVHDVARRLCAADPGARVWTIHDRSGLGVVHAAAPGGSPWQPLAAAAAQRHDCPAAPDTEAVRARRALAAAAERDAAGDAAGAQAIVRAAAVETFVQKELYLDLARRPETGAEAMYWARRAVHAEDWRDAGAILLLASLQAAGGDAAGAQATLARGIVETAGRGDTAGEQRLRDAAAGLGAASGSGEVVGR